jgi:hypothetical protein
MVIDSCPHEQVAMRCICHRPKQWGPRDHGPNRVARKLIYINFAKFKVGGASGVGTFETCRRSAIMSACGIRPEVSCTRSKRRE